MRITQISDEADDILLNVEMLDDPNIDLDLTSDPWFIGTKHAAEITGRDIIHRGRFGPNGGRKPLSPNLFDSGSGAVATSVLTDATKSWEVDALIGMWLELNGTWYQITDNTATTVTVTGGPGDGSYVYTIRRYALATLTMAEGADTQGACASRIRGYDQNNITDYSVTSTTIVRQGSSPAWPAGLPGGYVYITKALTGSPKYDICRIPHIAKIVSVVGDTLTFFPAMTTPTTGTRFSVIFRPVNDKRGIWITNGRKFWLLHDNTWILYLDLGEHDPDGGDYLGSTWHACRIASHLMMFVSPKYPARIIRLDRPMVALDPLAANVADNSSLAGLIPPYRPEEYETQQEGIGVKSWSFANDVSGGAITGGTYKMRIRAINADDGAESMIAVVDPATLSAGYYAFVRSSQDDNSSGKWTPPFHERWTHLQIYRSLAGGSVLHLEATVEIAHPANEESVTPVGNGYSLLSYNNRMLTYSDAVLDGLPILSTNDQLAGKPPPICQRAISVLGVTICAGRADAVRVNPRADACNFITWPGTTGGASYAVGTTRVTQTGKFQFYTWSDGDVFRIWYPLAYAGDYPISSKVSNDVIQLSNGPGADIANGLLGAIVQEYQFSWPYIESDEDVWYSRSDKFAPESFQIVKSDGTSRIVRVSGIGDTFRNLVAVGNYACMVMSGGVHLLYFSGTSLEKDTILTTGGGTPWANSVVVYDNVVLWARPEGVRVLMVSNEPDSDGHRGRLGWLDPDGRMRQWFEDSYRNGWDIDAGIDTHNGTIRFRRKIDANTFEVLEYSYLNKCWTQHEDDSGDFYARSRTADTTEQGDEILYSIGQDGGVFEENYFGLTHPYDGKTVQDVIEQLFIGTCVCNGTTTVTVTTGMAADALIGDMALISGIFYGITGNTTTQLTLTSSPGTGTKAIEIWSGQIYLDTPAAGQTTIFRKGMFSALMIGDVLRLRSPGNARDGTARIILWASADSIVFTSITGFANGDEFIIGANRFRIRFCPYTGPDRETVKRLDGVSLVAVPGDKTGHAGKFSVRTYINHDDAVNDEADQEIPIFDEDDVAFKTVDRVSSVEAIGQSLQLEIECIESRTDFRLQSVGMKVSDSGYRAEDASASA